MGHSLKLAKVFWGKLFSSEPDGDLTAGGEVNKVGSRGASINSHVPWAELNGSSDKEMKS